MLFLDLTLPTPAENLALDEALLDELEADESPRETLRLWEAPAPFVVLGRSSRRAAEVEERRSAEQGVPVLRRASGGLSIVAGPGCLMYAVLLDCDARPELRSLPVAHRFVLERIAETLAQRLPGVQVRGTSDLTLGERKFSGNSLRLKRRGLLYHGTLLYNFPLPLIETCLRLPPRAPEYRAGRAHQDFVMNLPLEREAIAAAVRSAFSAVEVRRDWPRKRTAQLVRDRYANPAWTAEF